MIVSCNQSLCNQIMSCNIIYVAEQIMSSGILSFNIICRLRTCVAQFLYDIIMSDKNVNHRDLLENDVKQLLCR